MKARNAAVIAGLIAGIAVGLILGFEWDAVTAPLRAGQAGAAAAWADPLSRLAWSIAAAGAVVAVVALLVAVVSGLMETMRARAELDRLRHAPELAGHWDAADWRAAFADTAVADRAEAIVAALLPDTGLTHGPDRRIFADPVLLLDLERIWLSRLTLGSAIAPLAGLLIAQGAAFALLRASAGAGGWEIPLSAGVSGWLLVTLARYIAGILLAPAVVLAARSAVAAVRPLGPALTLDVVQRIAARPSLASLGEPGVSVALFGEALAEPLARLADAADRLSATGEDFAARLVAETAILAARASELDGAGLAQFVSAAENLGETVQQRDSAIESALIEVRAGIERLLAAPPSGAAGADPEELSATIRRALAEQNEALMQKSQDLEAGIEQVASAQRALADTLESSRKPNGLTADPPAADELENLLRDLD